MQVVVDTLDMKEEFRDGDRSLVPLKDITFDHFIEQSASCYPACWECHVQQWESDPQDNLPSRVKEMNERQRPSLSRGAGSFSGRCFSVYRFPYSRG